MDNWTWRGQTQTLRPRGKPLRGEQGEMHAEEIRLAAEGGALTLEEHLAALRNERPRVFWLGFTFALLVHALFIIGIGRSSSRTLGKEDGASDAIAVEIVDGATLKDSMAPPAPPAAAPPAQQPQQQQQQPQQAQPEVPPTPPAPPEVAAVQPPPPPPEAAPPKETPADTPAQALPEDFADTLAELQDTPPDQEKPQTAPEQPKEAPKQETKPAEKPPPKPAEQKQQQAKPKPKPPQKRTQTSALDLSVPSDDGTDGDDSGNSSAVQRPPGITRSGENDEFARNVIRALQKSMPRERANGRVTVRIVLSENGSRADVKLLKSGGDPDLDFNVMFAARQTAYPFPPNNSTLVDRTFTVTYIYR
jgi:protein TonB